jgi:prepilin-type N-terminal cleavage/methylation domain-containing protein
MTGRSMISTRQGFTLIELIAAMVLVGLAAALAGTSFMSFTRIGEGKNYARNAQLAQQRMELILAQKRTTLNFSGCSDLDPCNDEDAGLENEDFCNDEYITADYNKIDSRCEIEIESGSQKFYMWLYIYE